MTSSTGSTPPDTLEEHGQPAAVSTAPVVADGVVPDKTATMTLTHDAVVAAARQHAGLDEDEATAIAVEETRAARRERPRTASAN